jgi:predicted DNA-binding protein YlxM (UPF0122 family)
MRSEFQKQLQIRDRAVIADYRAHKMLLTEIAEKHSISTTHIWCILKRHHVARNHSNVLKGKRQKIVRMFRSGDYFGAEIARKLNLNPTTVNTYLKKCGIRLSSRRYTLDESVFDEMDTFQKNYAFGLLLSDGSNDEEKGKIRLSLSGEDAKMIKWVQDFFGTNRPSWLNVPARTKKSHDSYAMEVHSRKISERLAELGMVARKTWCLTFPKWITLNNVRPLTLGYLDGNGSILTYKTKRGLLINVCIASTEPFLLGLRNILQKVLPDVHMGVCKNGPRGYLLQIRDRKGVTKFLNWLYKDVPVCFPRKKRAADLMLREIRKVEQE